MSFLKKSFDFFVTILLWFYFVGGFFIFFIAVYAVAYVVCRDRETAFQAVNHYFYKGFFILARIVCPGLSIDVPEEVKNIGPCVVVCNHLSFLDPILLISIFRRNKTFVRSDFFQAPVFGWIIKTSGYISPMTNPALVGNAIEGIEGLEDYIKSGGVLFLFPEGSRSKDGRVGKFSKGAFGIAKLCSVGVTALYIENTEKVFTPGRFLFNTLEKNTIKIRVLKELSPKYDDESFSIKSLKDEVRNVYVERQGPN